MFEWDEAKNASNIAKHGIGFARATAIFEGFVFTVDDDRVDYGELRQLSVGVTGNLFLTVVHTQRGEKIRSFRLVRRIVPKGDAMKKRYDRELSDEELMALPDEDIDYSDIPELGEWFWSKAVLVEPEKTKQVTLRVKESVLEAYRATGKGYQTRMNNALEAGARALMKQKKKAG